MVRPGAETNSATFTPAPTLASCAVPGAEIVIVLGVVPPVPPPVLPVPLLLPDPVLLVVLPLLDDDPPLPGA